MNEKPEHLDDSSCWCKPVCVFNAGEGYGRVYVHTDSDTGVLEDPGAEIIMVSVVHALYDDQEVHIKDYPEGTKYEHINN